MHRDPTQLVAPWHSSAKVASGLPARAPSPPRGLCGWRAPPTRRSRGGRYDSSACLDAWGSEKKGPKRPVQHLPKVVRREGLRPREEAHARGLALVARDAAEMSSKEEYLKRYLSGGAGGGGKGGNGSSGMATDMKKKKRKKRPGGLDVPAVKAKVLPGAIKMVDNDVSLASLVAREEDEEEGEEEAPVVVESAAARKAREVQVRWLPPEPYYSQPRSRLAEAAWSIRCDR